MNSQKPGLYQPKFPGMYQENAPASFDLPRWLIARVKEIAEQSGVSESTVVENALSQEIFPLKKISGTLVLIFALVCGLGQSVSAQEYTDQSLDLKLRPAIITPGPSWDQTVCPENGNTVTLETVPPSSSITISVPSTMNSSEEPKKESPQSAGVSSPGADPKKKSTHPRWSKARTACNIATPIINLGSAISNWLLK